MELIGAGKVIGNVLFSSSLFIGVFPSLAAGLRTVGGGGLAPAGFMFENQAVFGTAYIFNGAGAKGAGPTSAGMAVTPVLVLVFALPVAVWMILSMSRNRHR